MVRSPALGLFMLVCALVLTVVVSMSFRDLDRPEYPVPVENR